MPETVVTVRLNLELDLPLEGSWDLRAAGAAALHRLLGAVLVDRFGDPVLELDWTDPEVLSVRERDTWKDDVED
jgi:hypothetical protein